MARQVSAYLFDLSTIDPSELFYTAIEKHSAQGDQCRTLYPTPPPPKRSRLLCMRVRLRNPSLWPRVGVSFHVAKYVATTKRDLDHEC